MLELNEVYYKDCLEGMKDMSDNSVDLVVTDPPYGLEFMGKDWDKFSNVTANEERWKGKRTSKMKENIHIPGTGFKTLPSFSFSLNHKCKVCGHYRFSGTPCKCQNPEREQRANPHLEGYYIFSKRWATEALRVLKSGAFMFVLSSPRQDLFTRLLRGIEDAGFVTNFTSLYWTYASGFPKAQNISKAVDKRNERTFEDFKALGDYIKSQREKLNISSKDITKLFPSKTGGLTGCLWNWENGMNVPTTKQWQVLKEILQLDNRFDELIERVEAEREVIGKDKRTFNYASFDFGREWDLTISKIPQAKLLDGSYGGFQPKPAVECIIVAMKSLSEKTYTDQALKNRKGITWLDDGRIPYESESDKPKDVEEHISTISQVPQLRTNYTANRSGRFPANLLVSDDVLDDGVITKSSGGCGDKSFGALGDNVYGKYEKKHGSHAGGLGDEGTFSRYFDLDAWFLENVKKLPKEVQKTFPFLIVPKASKSEGNDGCENVFWEKNDAMRQVDKQRWTELKKMEEEQGDRISLQARGNIHPTKKPLKLAHYLVTLGSREGDVVLDPFVGSGWVPLACQQLNRNWIGFEIDEANKPIIDGRLSQKGISGWSIL